LGNYSHSSHFFIPSGGSEQTREGKKKYVKPHEKIGQNLGFVPLITARSLAGRQKNLRTTLEEEVILFL
jgi:hypothetical protein